ncbi:hypothetical protein PVAP13_8KG064784 [Panicum virgatum]|uniref:Uncharacterized protein n=1 Tax=Panicum virgatum TaxID=38727 RepID=A0A8T0PE07_PANVG|nr:hypothetical protein PVAP13_8KG064784 [Panicum virgatum]
MTGLRRVVPPPAMAATPAKPAFAATPACLRRHMCAAHRPCAAPPSRLLRVASPSSRPRHATTACAAGRRPRPPSGHPHECPNPCTGPHEEEFPRGRSSSAHAVAELVRVKGRGEGGGQQGRWVGPRD